MNWLDGMAIRVWGRRVSPLLVGWVSSKVQKGMAIVTQKLLILLLKDPNKNTKFENVLKSLRFVKVRGKNFQLLYFHLTSCYTFISAGPWKRQMARKTVHFFSSEWQRHGAPPCVAYGRFEWCETLLRAEDLREQWLSRGALTPFAQ